MASTFKLVEVTIPEGEALSDAVDLTGQYVHEIVMPASWDAAALTFQVGESSSAVQDVYAREPGGEYTIYPDVAAAGRRVLVHRRDLLGDGHLKVRSGTGASPVNQSADRVLTLKVRRAPGRVAGRR